MSGKDNNNDDAYIVFVQLQGLQRFTLQSGWVQMQARSDENFGDLLRSTLAELHKNGVLDESQMVDIGCLPCLASHYPTKATNVTDRVACTLQSTCAALPLAGNHHVRYSFNSFRTLEKLQAPPPKKKDPFATLMQAQQQHFFPDKYASPEDGKSALSFNLKLFNFVVDCLTARDCSVACEHTITAKKLALAMRDVLHTLASTKIPKSRLPEIFRHSLKPFEDRHRNSQQGLEKSLHSLRDAIISAHPFLNTSRWKLFATEVGALQGVLMDQIDKMKNDSIKNQERQKIVGNLYIERLADVEIVDSSKVVASKYLPVKASLRAAGNYVHLLVQAADIDKWDPSASITESPEAARKRHQRFRDHIQFSFPIGKYLFKPGGSLPCMLIIWKLASDRSDWSETSNRDLHIRVLDSLPRYHTRAVYLECQAKYGDLLGPGATSGILRAICRHLINDSTAPRDKEMEERMLRYVAECGDPDFWPDLRAAVNGGEEQYQTFFRVAEEVVGELTGATAYRHGEQRVLSSGHSELVSTSNPSLVSVPAFIKKVEERLLENEATQDADIPSIELVRLAFSPQYPHRKMAAKYRPRFELSRAITKATMRKENQDSHYNAKLNKMLNQFIIEFNSRLADELLDPIPSPTPDNQLVFSKAMTKVSVDDKAAVPIGEPGYPVRTNVRKLSASIIAEKDRNKATAGDHDWHKANVVPSMALFICTPEETQQSWRVGRVTCSLKDRATEHSTAMRHSVELVTQVNLLVAEDDANVAMANHNGKSPETMPENTSMPFMMALRADGGSDRNPKHAAVVIGSLNTFLALDLDVLLVLVTAADISHVNEVEGVMPTVNLGLQNQAFERKPMSQQCEEQFKHANSGKMIRQLIAKQPTEEAREACENAWRESVNAPRRAIESLLSQSVYTQHAVQMFDPASDLAVNEAFTYLMDKVDPKIDPKITTWAGVRKQNPDLCKYVESHVTIERYHLEIKKCGDDDCKTCRTVSIMVGSNFCSVLCKI
jgi:hypothetical protein